MPVTSYFIESELKHVIRDVMTQEFEDKLMANGSLVFISNEIDVGSRTYEFYTLTMTGRAKIISSDADDIPLVNVFKERKVGVIREIADAYVYTISDMEASQKAGGQRLETVDAIAAREGIEQVADEIGYVGDTNHNLLGIANHPNASTFTVAADGAGGSSTWTSKSHLQILRDLGDIISAMDTASNYRQKGNTLLLPISRFNQLSTRFLPNTSVTLLNAFLDTQRNGTIRNIQPVPFLETAGTGGTAMGILYNRDTTGRRIKMHMPLTFQQIPPQPHGLRFEVYCRAKTGGIQITKPESVMYIEGI